MRRDLVAAIGVLAIVVAGAARAQAPAGAKPAPDPLATWKVNHWGIEATAAVRDCLACHESTGIRRHTSHPLEVDYAAAQARPGVALRPLADAVKRGVYLPDGKIHCLTCHDPRSPWAHHLALPPGAAARRSVQPGVAATYSEGAARASPAPGDEVSPKPLCLLCHTYGD